ncbi:MAG: hypothetical protein GAK30_03826 [Paracidovorax wautersii]|uniref:Tripartite-type tricarboxylate transporter, receptor component TctC n=1 Tax=Paracidovorax wautersii TaxID=1177982 RepID=A0A7V8FKE6_9BURK|nr:MAG: hypothetical protein GAK30_03826 [Paracidovorax wautersii]
MRSRTLIGTLALMLAGLANAAPAQPFPGQEPLQLVVPFAAGGAVDTMARAFARGLSTQLGQQAIVLNKDGAGGTIGFWQVARAKPDGHVLAFGPSTPVTAGHLLSGGPKYDQFVPVCQTHENIMAVIVRENSPARSIQQLLALAKEQPGKISYGHAGQGTVPHLSMESFAGGVGLSFNAIAYRGDGPMVNDLMGGQLDAGVSSIAAAAKNNPRLRVLALFAGQRQPGWPDVPVMSEVGRTPLAPGLNGLWAPKGTSAEAIAVLEKACDAIVQSDEFRQTADALSQRPVFLSSKQYLQRVANDYTVLEKTIHTLNLK